MEDYTASIQGIIAQLIERGWRLKTDEIDLLNEWEVRIVPPRMIPTSLSNDDSEPCTRVEEELTKEEQLDIFHEQTTYPPALQLRRPHG